MSYSLLYTLIAYSINYNTRRCNNWIDNAVESGRDQTEHPITPIPKDLGLTLSK